MYDFTTHQRSETDSIHVRPSDVIIIEGILVLAMERIRNLLHMKIFVDTDDDVRCVPLCIHCMQSGRHIARMFHVLRIVCA